MHGGRQEGKGKKKVRIRTYTVGQLVAASLPRVIHEISALLPQRIAVPFGCFTIMFDCVGRGEGARVGGHEKGVGTDVLGTGVGRRLVVGSRVGARVGFGVGRPVGRGPQRSSVVGGAVDGTGLGAVVSAFGQRYTGGAACVFAWHAAQLHGQPAHSCVFVPPESPPPPSSAQKRLPSLLHEIVACLS